MRGSPIIIKPIIAGSAIVTTALIAQNNDSKKALKSLVAELLESLGKITVAIATPKTPKGNSIKRSEKYSQLMLPLTRNEASSVSTIMLI